jgi:cbb3-type cytochrome oxidase subunit 3
MDIIAFVAWLRPIVTIWVFLVFVGILGWIYWPRRRAVYDSAATIPLRDDR